MTAVLDSGEGVLMVLDGYFPTTGGGGAESQVRTLALRMRQRKLAVRVVTPMLREGRLIERESVEGIPVLRIRYPAIRVLGGLIMLSRLAWLLYRERDNYSAIHAHVAKNLAAVCAVMGRMLDKPVVVKLTGMLELQHGILAPDGDNLHRRLLRWAIRRSTWVQATSQRIRRGLLERGFDPLQVRTVPNAIDVLRFRPDAQARSVVRAELDVPSGTIVAVYAGRLATEKGVEQLVRAWQGATDGRDDAVLWMIGEGELRPILERQLQQASPTGRIRLLGSRHDIERYLAAADFAVLPSLAEGLSNSLLEYMATGLPTVGTRVSGTEDLIVSGVTGELVEPGDSASLEAGLRTMLATDPVERGRQGRTARTAMVDTASIDRVVETLAGLYGMPFPEPRGAPEARAQAA